MVDVAQRIIQLIAEQLDKDTSSITPRCFLGRSRCDSSISLTDHDLEEDSTSRFPTTRRRRSSL